MKAAYLTLKRGLMVLSLRVAELIDEGVVPLHLGSLRHVVTKETNDEFVTASEAIASLPFAEFDGIFGFAKSGLWRLANQGLIFRNKYLSRDAQDAQPIEKQ